jgi:hypothetical protein
LVSSAASRHLGVAEEGGWRRAAGEGQDGLVGHRALVLEHAQVRMFDPSTARRASWQHQRTNLRRRLSSTSDGAHPAARVQRQDGEADERASRGRSRKHELRHNVRRPVAAPEEHSHRDVVRAVAGPGVAEVCGPGSTTALALSLAPRKDRTWPEQNIALRSLWPNSAKRLQSTYFSSDAAQTNTTTIYTLLYGERCCRQFKRLVHPVITEAHTCFL